MRKSLSKPWTREEDHRVRQFVAGGLSVNRAAAALGRNRGSVLSRARKLGCPFLRLAEIKKQMPASPINEWSSHRRPSRLRED
jgi:hypothetical protein